MRRFALALLLAASGFAPAQEPVSLEIKGDVEVVKVTRLVPLVEDREIIKKLPFDVLAPKDADGYWWVVPAGVTATDKGDTLEIMAAPNGELTIKIKLQTITFDIDFEKKTVKKRTTFTFGSRTLNIGTIAPPVPPPPPIPPPEPKPPAPIPLAGFRVLIIYDPATLTPNQGGIVFGKKVRDYLQAKCVVGADGKTKDFRIYQTGLDTSAEVAWINDTIQRHPGQKSYFVVSNGTTGYDGPLPASAEEALAILTKIGG